MNFDYDVSGNDISQAGFASSDIKKKLKQLGLPPLVIKRVAVAMYEAEMNMIVHAGGGIAHVSISDTEITIIMKDEGPGIKDIEKAMQEGFSTAPESARKIGFGAGMGLSNMKRNTNALHIRTKEGCGTTVTMKIRVENI